MYDNTALRRLLIELAASHPEHAAVIRAFTPLALARGKLLDAYALSRKTKPLEGFPMFRFEELPVCSEKSGAIASAVLEAVAEGFPGAREQVEAVRDALKPGSVRRLCKASLAHEPEPLALFAEKNGLSPDVLDMVIAQTVKILMARTANSLPEAPFDPARKTCRTVEENRNSASFMRRKGIGACSAPTADGTGVSSVRRAPHAGATNRTICACILPKALRTNAPFPARIAGTTSLKRISASGIWPWTEPPS